MSRADNWMPLYVADYLRDTMRLTTEQHGAYFLLLLECWNGGGVLPADDAELAAIVRQPLPAWRKIKPTLARYFTITAAEWSHKRVREEHEKAARLSAVKAENGRKGGRPPKQTESSEKPTAFLQPKLHKTPALVAEPPPSPPPPEVSEVAIAPSGAASATPQRRAELALLAEALEAKGVSTKRAKPKAQVPDDWRPSDKLVRYAVEHGMHPEAVDAEVERFRNHHRARGNLFADVEAAWRTWAGNHTAFKPRQGARDDHHRSSPGHDKLRAIAAAMREGIPSEDFGGPHADAFPH